MCTRDATTALYRRIAPTGASPPGALVESVSMPSSIWTGSISFGLVQVPVRMITATRSKDVSFNQLEADTNARIRYRKVSEVTGEEVPQDQIVRGYEISKGKYVRIED